MKILIESDGQGGLNYEIQGSAVQLNEALRVMYWKDAHLRKAINALCVELAPVKIGISDEVANQNGGTSKTFIEHAKLKP